MKIEKICQSIDKKHQELGHTLGWRFINSSSDTIKENSGICLITLNPSGNTFEKSICVLKNKKNAYLDESWGNKDVGKDKLQIQIQHLFNEIHTRTNTYENNEILIRNSFMAHFVPFRSNTFDELHNKNLSVEFSKQIWRQILNSENFKFSIIICIAKEHFEFVNEILLEKYELNITKELNTGWGAYKAIINQYSIENRKLKIIYLQHLSRFSIFNRKENKGKPEIERIFNYLLK